jgi:hypothetical protein
MATQRVFSAILEAQAVDVPNPQEWRGCTHLSATLVGSAASAAAGGPPGSIGAACTGW